MKSILGSGGGKCWLTGEEKDTMGIIEISEVCIGELLPMTTAFWILKWTNVIMQTNFIDPSWISYMRIKAEKHAPRFLILQLSPHRRHNTANKITQIKQKVFENFEIRKRAFTYY